MPWRQRHRKDTALTKAGPTLAILDEKTCNLMMRFVELPNSLDPAGRSRAVVGTTFSSGASS
jgi:hypothetical protein